MTAEEVLAELRQLFPEQDYAAELDLFTDGSAEIQVFLTESCRRRLGRECLNVIDIGGPTPEACLISVREWLQSNNPEAGP
jgi:hypothetical protein